MGQYRIGAKAYKHAYYEKTKNSTTYTEAHRKYYETHKAIVFATSARSRDKKRKEAREWTMEFLRTHPCVDCGLIDPVVMEFDHLPGMKKKAELSLMVKNGWPLRRIQEEIAKCDVVCANCHRRRTAKRANTYRHRLSC